MRGVIIVLAVVGLLFIGVLALGSGGGSGYDSESPWVDRLQRWFPAKRVAPDEIEAVKGAYRDGVFTLPPGGPCQARVAEGDRGRTLELKFKGRAVSGVRVLYRPHPDDQDAFAFDKPLKDKPLKLQVEAHGGTLTLVNSGRTPVQVTVVQEG